MHTHKNKNLSKYNTKDQKHGKREKQMEKKKKRTQHNQQSINKTAIHIYLEITTLNVNGLNAPIK